METKVSVVTESRFERIAKKVLWVAIIIVAVLDIVLAASAFSGCMEFIVPYRLTIVDVGNGKIIQEGGFPVTFGGVRCITGSSCAIDFEQAGRWGDEFYAWDVRPGQSWFFYWDYDAYPHMSITARMRGTSRTITRSFTGNALNPPTITWTVYVDGKGNLRDIVQ